MFAGRNISATHIGFSSTRVMATCAAIGQGVGTAGAYSVASGVQPSELASSSDSIDAIQQALVRDDAFLVGVSNKDAADLARGASVSATSEHAEHPAANVISGQSRAIHGEGGVPENRTTPGSHRWMSEALPAELELRWASPVTVSEIDLVFDTGMHRPLTLSHSDAYVQKMKWGRPQPETVRDYVIEGESDGKWVVLREETGNYLRHRRHSIKPDVKVSAIRVTVTAANGVDHARICEIRAYT